MNQSNVKCPRCGTANPAGQARCSLCGTGLTAPPQAQNVQPNPAQSGAAMFRRGQIVANRYTVVDMIGRGGMGCIYKVRDNALKEDVALKTLLPRFTNDKLVVERFFNEARIARQLAHPNIVRVHDIGMAGKVIYISMEYVAGRSLRSVIDHLPPGQRLPIEQTLRIMDQLCACLEYAHKYTIHRDIKPENVMVLEDGTVKLMDFGISKLMSSTQLTSTAVVMGTPKYMSPEQLKDSSSVDARADVYSVGVMFYEILTGNPPSGVPKPASETTYNVPPSIDPIVAKCLEPDPIDRYQSAEALRDDLRPILELVESGTDVSAAHPYAPIASGGNEALVRKLAGITLVALVAVLMGLGVWKLEGKRQASLAESVVTETQPADPVPASNTGPGVFATRFGELKEQVTKARAAGESHIEQLVRAEEMARTTMNQAEEETRAEEEARVAAKEAATKRARAALGLGDKYWTSAQDRAGSRDPNAFNLAWYALQCFLGPAICPDDMTFVPPGEAVVDAPPSPDAVMLDGFFIEKTEVTNRQFRRFAESVDGGWRVPAYFNHVEWTDALDRSPVATVAFYDAQAYAGWLGRLLPTEAQWARAAYGDENSLHQYPWGMDWDPAVYSCGGAQDGYDTPAPAGSFEKDVSPYGCYDMAGNVREWTRSAFKPLPYDPSCEDPKNVCFGAEIAVRGGHFQDEKGLFLSVRSSALFETISPEIGFRCVQPLPSSLGEIDGLIH